MNRLFSLSLNNEQNFPSSLFYRVVGGNVIFKENTLLLDKNSSVSFDTFFNCFSYSKYLKYTNINSLNLTLELKGKGVVKVYIKRSTKDCFELIDGKKLYEISKLNDEQLFTISKIVEQDFDFSKKKTLSIEYDFSKEEAEGLIYFEIESYSGVTVYDGGYYTQNEVDNDVKIGIVFCTYKREGYINNNLKIIKNYLDNNPLLQDKFKVFVIDNGQTLEKDEANHYYDIYKNKNLGGSGGFTRGIMEVCADDTFTHFLLMDDDVVIIPDVFYKLYSILTYAKDINRLTVGGNMMILDNPTIQFELGATWSGRVVRPINQKFDLIEKTKVFINEIDRHSEYSGWWFTCMPTSFAKEHNLPLPMFIKSDDMEYGMRFDETGDIMYMNGIGIWHEDFEKKYSGELEYYTKRNGLIMNCFHKPKDKFSSSRKLWRAMGKQLAFQSYDCAELIIKSYKDFLKGPKFLLETDGQKLHQQLRAMSPKIYNGEQLKKMGYNVDGESYKPNIKYRALREFLTLNGHLIPNCFYNKKERKEGRIVPLADAKINYFYKSSLSIHYNKSSDRGFVTKQSRLKLIKYLFKALWVNVLLIFKYRKVRKQYQQQFDNLTSFDFWKKTLDI